MWAGRLFTFSFSAPHSVALQLLDESAVGLKIHKYSFHTRSFKYVPLWRRSSSSVCLRLRTPRPHWLFGIFTSTSICLPIALRKLQYEVPVKLRLHRRLILYTSRYAASRWKNQRCRRHILRISVCSEIQSGFERHDELPCDSTSTT